METVKFNKHIALVQTFANKMLINFFCVNKKRYDIQIENFSSLRKCYLTYSSL